MDSPKFIGKAKVTKQGQVTLPFEARKDLSIPIESEIYWYEINDCLVVVKDLVNQKDLLDIVNHCKRGKK
jgi:bifunctional DNA-binding transcriptional regulator/antitoxin component of YhaV-PrlF toxin-antitoxin module